MTVPDRHDELIASTEAVPARGVPAIRRQALCSPCVGRKEYPCPLQTAHSCEESMQLISRTSLQGPGQLAHVAQIVKQLGMATYYGADMFVWLQQQGFTKFDKE